MHDLVIQVIKETLLNLLNQMCSDRGAACGLLCNHDAVGAREALTNHVPIDSHRVERAQINHLGIHTSSLNGGHRFQNHTAIRQHRAGGSRAHQPRLTKGHDVIKIGFRH